MKKHMFSGIVIVLLLSGLGFILSFSFIREALETKLTVMRIDFIEEKKTLQEESWVFAAWVKRSVYSPRNIISLPFEGDVHCDDHKMSKEEVKKNPHAWGNMRLEYPNFRSLRTGGGFVIEMLSGQTITSPYAFLYGDDLIEMAPIFQPEAYFTLGTEASIHQYSTQKDSYPCVAYIRGNTINPKVDKRCLQVMIGDWEPHLGIHFRAGAGVILKISKIGGYYEEE